MCSIKVGSTTASNSSDSFQGHSRKKRFHGTCRPPAASAPPPPWETRADARHHPPGQIPTGASDRTARAKRHPATRTAGGPRRMRPGPSPRQLPAGRSQTHGYLPLSKDAPPARFDPGYRPQAAGRPGAKDVGAAGDEMRCAISRTPAVESPGSGRHVVWPGWPWVDPVPRAPGPCRSRLGDPLGAHPAPASARAVATG